ncbi:MAG: flagellar export chaperone FliS [Oscillospiraceae bacterium]|nr:flagellar export chaperone FliS [Oscillospiraceae bacterium]
MQQMVMVNSRPQDAYRKQDIMTANSIDLIVMLYDALKKNIILGKRGILKHDVQFAHKHLIRAQEILSELINSLDMSYPISDELMALYEFALSNIEDANMHKHEEPLVLVIEIVDSLREAWKEISASNKGARYLQEVQA